LILLIQNKLTAILCCFLILLSPTYSLAADSKIKPEAVSPGVITELRKGQCAPYAGVLFSKDAAAKLYTQLKFSEKDCQLKLSKKLDLLKLDYDTRLKLSQLRLDTETEKNKSLLSVKDSRIKYLEKNLRPPSWYEAGEFWFAMGVVGGILITVASGYALSQASK